MSDRTSETRAVRENQTPAEEPEGARPQPGGPVLNPTEARGAEIIVGKRGRRIWIAALGLVVLAVLLYGLAVLAFAF